MVGGVARPRRQFLPLWLRRMERTYLAAYNACVTGAWGVVVAKWAFLVAETYRAGEGGSPTRLVALLPYGQLAEFMAALEIFNGVMRLTGASVVGAVLLHLGRGIVLFWIISHFPIVHEGWSASALLAVWGFGDMSRFGYLALSKMGLDSKALKTLRYAIPLVLFPLGVVLEVVQVMGALLESRDLRYVVPMPILLGGGGVEADENGRLTLLHMPARPLLALFLLTYVPGAPYMYRLIHAAWRKHAMGMASSTARDASGKRKLQ